jgi:hypothetical protein
LNSGWDNDLLALELGELSDDGFDLDLLGFDVDELDNFDKEEHEIKEQNSPNDFKEVGETELNHKCPKCGFEYDV